MPTDTPDQQITLPVGPDTANNPLAFNQSIADVEPRLVREYTTEADRTARMLVLAAGDISSLSAPATGPARTEIYNGSNHISLYTRSLYTFASKTADETVNNTTTLQNDDTLLAAVPSAGTFAFDLTLFYTSSNTADIKFAFTIPAGATLRWGVCGLATTATASTGDGQWASATGSATAVAIGGANGTTAMASISGMLLMGGTAGILQLQWAQNTLEVSNTTVNTFSNMRVWRTL